jgi:hypothetical protein
LGGNVDFNDRLRRYRTGQFTDEDVTRCTGLSVRAWRELIKLGAIRTITDRRGPGRVRVCDATTFKRTAVIAAINAAGFSLAVAGRIAYFLPFEELMYAICDPFTVLFLHGAADDPETGLPPRRKTPAVDWFDPDTPAKVDPANDWYIEIYDGHFVVGNYKVAGQTDEPFIYGELRDDGTTFVSWLAFHERRPVFDSRLKGFVDTFNAKWEQPNAWSDRLDRNFLKYQYEQHDAEDDPLRMAAEVAVRSPVFKTTINITLALRKALRRYLHLEPTAPPLNSNARVRYESRE